MRAVDFAHPARADLSAGVRQRCETYATMVSREQGSAVSPEF
jgi:hypothetical protein